MVFPSSASEILLNCVGTPQKTSSIRPYTDTAYGFRPVLTLVKATKGFMHRYYRHSDSWPHVSLEEFASLSTTTYSDSVVCYCNLNQFFKLKTPKKYFFPIITVLTLMLLLALLKEEGILHIISS